jgi:DHA2 family methylenomycin A resistance protein-like MFS transporter
MLPLALFRTARVSGAAASVFVQGFTLLGTVFFLAQYFQAIQGLSAFETGLRSLPVTLGLFVAAPFAGRIAARYGFRPPILAGALAASAGLLLLTGLTPTTPYAELWWKLALIGLGFGLMASPLTAAVLTAAPPNRSGMASSMTNTSRQIGSVFGVALLGSAVQGAFAGSLANRLAEAHVPANLNVEVATRVAAAGSLAVHLQPNDLPLDTATWQTITSTAFTDALHVAYLGAGLAVLLIAAAALTLLGPRPVSAQAEPVLADDRPVPVKAA